MTTPTSITPGNLGGNAEIAALLLVSRQRVTQLTKKPDFPSPIAELSMGDVYDLAAVQFWAMKNDRDLVDRLTMTFGQYLDESIAVADEAADLDVMRSDFLAFIEPYGFALDEKIPANFVESMRKFLF